MTTSFIEKQFPVSKVSKESYKERKANNGQTLTGLGKWWGRKPLVLVRAAILGCLLPATDNPKKDMEIFLKIMTMDESGLWLRKEKNFSSSDLYEIIHKTPRLDRKYSMWFELDASGEKIRVKKEAPRDEMERAAFDMLGYDARIALCVRPEQTERPKDDFAWSEINQHLGTSAHSLTELTQQLSVKRFGKNVTVGDCFCGGGSIPFEAARMGCDTYASDLNPVAGLLTWAGINICGASDANHEAIKAFQQEVYDKVDKEITKLGIEHNEKSDRAVSYLYCVEVYCPECGIRVPMAPSWVIGKGTKTIAKWTKNGDHYDVTVKMNASADEMKSAENGTATSRGLLCPHCGKTTPISVLRRDRTDVDGKTIYGLRMWEQYEFEPRTDDVFQEQLYAIKYERVELLPNGKTKTTRYYRAPNQRDIENEEKVREIVAKNLKSWQEQGLVPSMEIEPGYNTDEPRRNRGWSYWHQLFNARQLFVNMLFSEYSRLAEKKVHIVASILGLNKCALFNSKLSMWVSSAGVEKPVWIFTNQALNPMFNYGSSALASLWNCWAYQINKYPLHSSSLVQLMDARDVRNKSELWITDPPYADAVNYHELQKYQFLGI